MENIGCNVDNTMVYKSEDENVEYKETGTTTHVKCTIPHRNIEDLMPSPGNMDTEHGED